MDLRKIYGGTPAGNESRCDTCVYSRIIRGYAESEKITICDRLYEPMRVPFKVSECSDYVNKCLPSIEAMEAIAWYIRPKSSDSRAGFVVAARQDEAQTAQEPEEARPQVAATLPGQDQ